MEVSSRTPEGETNHCPVCGKFVCITPSQPAGDAPCPHCGVLLWFLQIDGGFLFARKSERSGQRGSSEHPAGNWPTRIGSGHSFEEGDLVRITQGTFASFEGTVAAADLIPGKVTVTLTIFGRPTPVELESWQLQPLSGSQRD